MKLSWRNFVNPFMKWLLVSPFHGLVSAHYVLVGFTGRKSGKPYATPVEYVRRDNQILFVTSKQYVWWKNLQGGAPVVLRLRGQEVRGVADVHPEPDAVNNTVRTLYPRFSASLADSITARSVAVSVQLGA